MSSQTRLHNQQKQVYQLLLEFTLNISLQLSVLFEWGNKISTKPNENISVRSGDDLCSDLGEGGERPKGKKYIAAFVLQNAPFLPTRSLGSAVSSPVRFGGETPAAVDFGVFPRRTRVVTI